MIYLDNAATTKIDGEILETYIRIQNNFFANTTSLHKLGQEANFMLEKSKKEMLQILGMPEHDVIFTSNATEANNIAILGLTKYKQGNVITSKIEHPSVGDIIENLPNKNEVRYVNTLANGVIDINHFKSLIDKDTLLVSIMWVNNIVGSIQPIKEIIEIVKKYPKCKLHIDAVQGICKEVNDFKFSDVDMLSFSTHKIYGPKGVGALIYNKSLNLDKITYGSYGQAGLKPGTLDLALCCSTVKCIKKFYPKTLENRNYVKTLCEYTTEEIKKIDKVVLLSNGNKEYDIYNPYIINISIPNIKGETIVHYLEKYDIYVSTGASCSSKLQRPEKTILQMTNNDQLSKTAIRISFSHTSTIEECRKLIECLRSIAKGE